MKTIILNEKQMSSIIKQIIKEESVYMGDKEDIIKKWLDNHFKQMEMDIVGDNGLPTKQKVVSTLDTNKQLTKNIIDLNKLFFILQTQFKNILSDKKERDEFLWVTLNKWYK